MTSAARLQLERLQRALSGSPAQLEKLIGHVLGISDLIELAGTNDADVRVLGAYTIQLTVSIAEATAAAPQHPTISEQMRPIRDVIDEITVFIEQNRTDNASFIESTRIRFRADEVVERIKKLRQKLDDAVRVYEFNSGVQLHIDFRSMHTTMSSVQAGVEQLQRDAQDVQSGVDGIQTTLEGVQMGVEDVRTRVELVHAGVHDLQAGVQRVYTDFYSLHTGIHSMQAGVHSLQDIVQRLEQRVVTGDETTLHLHVFSKFPVSSWDSHKGCLKDTRVDIIPKITSWARDRSPDKPKVFWLEGMAGCGKSTIAHSVAEALSGNGSDGAVVSFFFKRGEAGNDDPSVVLSALARDLSQIGMPLRRGIMDALRRKNTLCGESLAIQLRELLVTPIHNLVNNGLRPSPVTVIWEAFDECGTPESREQLLDLWAANLQDLSPLLQFFITSRPEPDILRVLDDHNLKPCKLALEPATAGTVQDIGRYFDWHLPLIAKTQKIHPPWPTQEERDGLVERAGGLFIWASTVKQFLARENSKKALKLLLQHGALASAESPIDALYMFVIDNAVPSMSRNDFIVVVGTIVVLFDRLTIPGLVGLLHGLLDEDNDEEEDTQDVTIMLHSLRSILHVDGQNPITLLHQSFPDFLTSENRCPKPEFRVKVEDQHLTLTLQCLRIMKQQLKRDICQVGDPAVKNADIQNLEERLRVNVSEELRYACLHFTNHLQ